MGEWIPILVPIDRRRRRPPEPFSLVLTCNFFWVAAKPALSVFAADSDATSCILMLQEEFYARLQLLLTPTVSGSDSKENLAVETPLHEQCLNQAGRVQRCLL